MLESHLDPAFAEITSALDALNSFRDIVVGRVIGPLLEKNPNLELEISATDRLVDIVREGFDAGIRFGYRVTDGMIAVRIRPRLRLVVVGSPAYFAQRPKPETPHELKRHLCIQNMYPSVARYA